MAFLDLDHEVYLIEKYRVAPLELRKIVDAILDFANENKISETWNSENSRWMPAN